MNKRSFYKLARRAGYRPVEIVGFWRWGLAESGRYPMVSFRPVSVGPSPRQVKS